MYMFRYVYGFEILSENDIIIVLLSLNSIYFKAYFLNNYILLVAGSNEILMRNFRSTSLIIIIEK